MINSAPRTSPDHWADAASKLNNQIEKHALAMACFKFATAGADSRQCLVFDVVSSVTVRDDEITKAVETVSLEMERSKMSVGDFEGLTGRTLRRIGAAVGAVGLLFATASGAMAGGSIKDAPAPEGRKLEWSFNVGGTSDYVFRGISQSAGDPAVQGGFDMTYGWFYAGAWMSTLDFGKVGSKNIVWSEVDLYAGIKPKFGMFTFDFGGIYYAYPGAKDAAGELDYVELKAGVSVNPIKPLTVGVTGFWSPEYTGNIGEVWTIEGSVAYELPKFHMFTPTLGALVGYQKGDAGSGFGAGVGLDDNYTYWNAGLALAVDKLTLDFRYWDTNIDGVGGICGAATFQCDERFVFSAKVTLP